VHAKSFPIESPGGPSVGHSSGTGSIGERTVAPVEVGGERDRERDRSMEARHCRDCMNALAKDGRVRCAAGVWEDDRRIEKTYTIDEFNAEVDSEYLTEAASHCDQFKPY
jgi:hypothetical protein